MMFAEVSVDTISPSEPGSNSHLPPLNSRGSKSLGVPEKPMRREKSIAPPMSTPLEDSFTS